MARLKVPVTQRDHIQGPEDAPITLVERQQGPDPRGPALSRGWAYFPSYAPPCSQGYLFDQNKTTKSLDAVLVSLYVIAF